MAKGFQGNWKGDTAIDRALNIAKRAKRNHEPITLAEQLKAAEVQSEIDFKRSLKETKKTDERRFAKSATNFQAYTDAR